MVWVGEGEGWVGEGEGWVGVGVIGKMYIVEWYS